MSVYTEFRKDGWPFCPRCGMDELYNPWIGQEHFHDGKPPPTVNDFIAAGLACLFCGWQSDEAKAALAQREML